MLKQMCIRDRQEVIAGSVKPEDLMSEVQEIAEEVQSDSEE